MLVKGATVVIYFCKDIHFIMNDKKKLNDISDVSHAIKPYRTEVYYKKYVICKQWWVPLGFI